MPVLLPPPPPPPCDAPGLTCVRSRQALQHLHVVPHCVQVDKDTGGLAQLLEGLAGEGRRRDCLLLRLLHDAHSASHCLKGITRLVFPWALLLVPMEGSTGQTLEGTCVLGSGNSRAHQPLIAPCTCLAGGLGAGRKPGESFASAVGKTMTL
ncbi:hypothetical protein E2C01_098422 [Portunus trituberculatus]|uniref:Uncharacterized protein n=1 Tax=Portunus trituberculatus TaxID=210409 RepID=A0A5B7K8C7_PORTR|nr:hypothetical protein [Portunus trituberculatus]